jgi:hypothetical protein
LAGFCLSPTADPGTSPPRRCGPPLAKPLLICTFPTQQKRPDRPQSDLTAQSLPNREGPTRPTRNPAFAGFFESGRPDLNRGPHRPELWAKSGGALRSTCKSMGSGSSSPPLGTSDLAVDSRGFGRGMDSLPNDEAASAGASSAPDVHRPTADRRPVHRPRFGPDRRSAQSIGAQASGPGAPARRGRRTSVGLVTTLDPLEFTSRRLSPSLGPSIELA